LLRTPPVHAAPSTIFMLCRDRLWPALSPAAIAGIVQRRAQRTGVKGNFGGHCACSGFVTEASRQGIPCLT